MSEQLSDHQIEQPTYRQLEEQGPGATVLVPRRNGEITTGRLIEDYENGGMPVVEVMNQKGEPAVKPVYKEGLSDQVQEKLATQLGGTALRSKDESSIEMLMFGTDEQIEAHQAELRAADEENAKADWEAGRLERERAAADHKYNQAKLAGASHEAAKRSALRAYTK